MASPNFRDLVELTQDLRLQEFHLKGNGAELRKKLGKKFFMGKYRPETLFPKGTIFVFEFLTANSIILSKFTPHGPSKTIHYRLPSLKHASYLSKVGEYAPARKPPTQPHKIEFLKELRIYHSTSPTEAYHFALPLARKELIKFLNENPVEKHRVLIQPGKSFILEGMARTYVVLTVVGPHVVSGDHYTLQKSDFEHFKFIAVFDQGGRNGKNGNGKNGRK